MAITIDGDSGVSGVNGSATTPALQGTDSNTGIVFGTDTVQVATGGTSRIEVNAANAAVVTIPQDGNQLLLKQTDTDSGYLLGCNNTNGDLTFSRRSTGSNTEEFRMLAGGGLTFNGDTAAANALDDYEEGDWTPTIPGTSITYTTRNGHYVKIGKVVWIQCEVNISGGTVSSSFSILTGLPFTSRTVEYPKMTIATNGGNWNGGAVPVAQVQPNATSLAAIGITNNSGFNNINATHLWDATGNWVAIAGIYEVP